MPPLLFSDGFTQSDLHLKWWETNPIALADSLKPPGNDGDAIYLESAVTEEKSVTTNTGVYGMLRVSLSFKRR